MIEIIKEGKPNWHECICPDCKTEFKYTLSSTYRELSRSKVNAVCSGDIYPRYINCPVCGIKIDL